MFGVSMALGPVLGGILTGTVGWRSIFWVNVPVGLVAIVLVSRFVPESRAGVQRRLDLVAQVLVIVMLGSLVYAIIEGAQTDWRERRDPRPVRAGRRGGRGSGPVGTAPQGPAHRPPLFPQPAVHRSRAHGHLLVRRLGGFLFLSTIYLQDARGLSALHAGLHMLPAAAAMAVCPLLAARLVAKKGLRVPLTVGGVALTLSMAAMSRLTASSGEVYLIAAFALFGIGLGMVNSQISHAAVSAMPSSQAGLASGIASASRQMGQALGVAVSGALLSANLHGPERTDFALASRPAWCADRMRVHRVLARPDDDAHPLAAARGGSGRRPPARDAADAGAIHRAAAAPLGLAAAAGEEPPGSRATRLASGPPATPCQHPGTPPASRDATRCITAGNGGRVTTRNRPGHGDSPGVPGSSASVLARVCHGRDGAIPRVIVVHRTEPRGSGTCRGGLAGGPRWRRIKSTSHCTSSQGSTTATVRRSGAHVGSSVPACSATMYRAYQSGQFASAWPMRFSCSPWAADARRIALARSLAEPNDVAAGSTRPGSRVVTSCSSQPLPSGSLNVANEP